MGCAASGHGGRHRPDLRLRKDVGAQRHVARGAKTALTAASDFRGGRYTTPPARALQAFCRVYTSLVFCADFYRDREYAKLGLASPEDTMRFFEGFFRQGDANDLLATLATWQQADISANETYNGDLGSALHAIAARAIVMPSTTDFLFQVGDSELEAGQMPNAELRPIRSSWGHVAGFGANPPDNNIVDVALEELLRGAKSRRRPQPVATESGWDGSQ